MMFRTTHFELEIANFLFLRTPLLGRLYMGPDAGFGWWMRIGPKEVDYYRREYLDNARRHLRARAYSDRNAWKLPRKYL